MERQGEAEIRAIIGSENITSTTSSSSSSSSRSSIGGSSDGGSESVQRGSGGRSLGLALVGVTGGAALALSIIAAPFVTPALRKVCLPYVPATTQQVSNVLAGLRGRSGRLVDLGSGDGRIVVAAAREAKLRSVGVELNPWLVWYSRWSAWQSGVTRSTSFVAQDLWRVNLQDYQNVVIFGVEEMMSDLEAKLSQELTSDGLVIACRFPLPSWTPTATIGQGIDSVWLYRRPHNHHHHNNNNNNHHHQSHTTTEDDDNR